MSVILRKKSLDQWARIETKTVHGKAANGNAPSHTTTERLHISWGSIEKATSYLNVNDLQTAFTQALADMELTAKEKADAINAKGGTTRERGYYYSYAQTNPPPSDYKKGPLDRATMTSRLMEQAAKYDQDTNQGEFLVYLNGIYTKVPFKAIQSGTLSDEALTSVFNSCGYVYRESQVVEHLPKWVQEVKDSKQFLADFCLIESQAKSENFLQAKDAYFVRSSLGWLGVKKGMYQFLPQMQQATLFFQQESALSAAQGTLAVRHKRIDISDCAFIKTQLVITQVFGTDPRKDGWRSDHETGKLVAGCEALQIEQLINQATAARQQAYDSLEVAEHNCDTSEPVFTKSARL